MNETHAAFRFALAVAVVGLVSVIAGPTVAQHSTGGLTVGTEPESVGKHWEEMLSHADYAEFSAPHTDGRSRGGVTAVTINALRPPG